MYKMNISFSFFVLIAFIVLMETLIWYSISQLPNATDDINSTVGTLRIIHYVGLCYPIMLVIIWYFMSQKGLASDTFMTYFTAIAAFLYLGITIASCVYAYKLPDKDEDNPTECNCDFEKYSSLLRVFCVVATISSALYGGVLVSFQMLKGTDVRSRSSEVVMNNNPFENL